MLRRLLRDTAGSIAVEFAATFPFLVLVYIGGYVAVDEVACNRKVSVATRTLADLLSRGYSPSTITANPSGTDVSSILTAAAITLTPYNVANATENVALVRVCDASHAYVIWTQAMTYTSAGAAVAGTPVLTANSLSSKSVITLPTNLATAEMIPTSPDGSNICSNFSPSTDQTTQVGTAGAFLFLAEFDYSYNPMQGFGFPTTAPLGNMIFMAPRLT